MSASSVNEPTATSPKNDRGRLPSPNVEEFPSKLQNGLAVDKQLDPLNSQKKGQRPIWFIFSGIGSQWAKMGRDLLKFPAFEASLKKPAETLKKVGLDLYAILDKNEPTLVEMTVSITAMQIGLVDLLKSIGVTPDGIIGHSMGEIGAAYADGCVSSEEAVMIAHARGTSISECCIPENAMAAIGLNWAETKLNCLPGIYLACHNSAEGIAVSGPRDKIDQLIQTLEAQNIFAKLINSSGMAYHSKYIAEAGPEYKKRLERIIQKPVLRSRKWVSSSQQDNPQWLNADYFVNNELGPVLFHAAALHIPDGAIVVEVAGHGVMQHTLKKSLPSCIQVPLMERDQNNVEHFLNAVGQLQNAGVNVNVTDLYAHSGPNNSP